MVCDGVTERARALPAGAAVRRARALRGPPALRRAELASPACAPRRRRVRPRRPRRRSAARGRARWRPTCASCSPPSRTSTCARCSIGRVRRAVADLGQLTATRPRPSATTRPTATGCSSTRLTVAQARQRDRGDVPRHRPRRRGHRRAAARHRQARGLRRADPRRSRSHRRRPAAGRDPARLLPRPPRDRGPRRLPGASSPQAVLHIILSHHGSLEHGSPVVPVHARGDARAHDRQPRRPAGLLRPAREGAARGRALVGLRQGARRRRVLRLPPSQADREAA